MPYFMKTSPILPNPHFQFLSKSLFPCHLESLPPLLFFCCHWLTGCSHNIWCVVLLKDIMNLHMSNFGALVTQGPCYVFYARKCQVNWGQTLNKVFCWYSDLISHTHTHTPTHPPTPHTHTHTQDLENICQRIKLTLIFRALFCSEWEGKDKITPPLPLPPIV